MPSSAHASPVVSLHALSEGTSPPQERLSNVTAVALICSCGHPAPLVCLTLEIEIPVSGARYSTWLNCDRHILAASSNSAPNSKEQRGTRANWAQVVTVPHGVRVELVRPPQQPVALSLSRTTARASTTPNLSSLTRPSVQWPQATFVRIRAPRVSFRCVARKHRAGSSYVRHARFV
ncbi:hypothetical protein K438DRAFT_1964631 [Mycena galopus ATCC 62051]|nr:hypothetical protein K438DRAFT_1964631 [Mycena galopus ATCC 62051]